MRLVLDTNAALSGLLWGGTPGRLIDLALAGRVELASTKQIARRGLAVADLFDGYAALVVIVTPAVIRPTIKRDPADDEVLAAALAAQADLIVSGDAHLLDLARFGTIEIVNAAAAVARITADH